MRDSLVTSEYVRVQQKVKNKIVRRGEGVSFHEGYFANQGNLKDQDKNSWWNEQKNLLSLYREFSS